MRKRRPSSASVLRICEVKIPKRSGGFRLIVVPSKTIRLHLRSILPDLATLAMALDVHGVQHGFVPCRSPVTNALVHVGYRWTVCFDLADCFDHVTEQKVLSVHRKLMAKLVNWSWSRYMFINGVARQGLPTSPALCNIALAPLDSVIVGWLRGYGVYTRYADDLTISTNDRDCVDDALVQIPQFCEQAGFPVNPRKTEVQDGLSRRRHITGVGVDDTGIHPTRKVKRRLRAARHQCHWRHARGLAEWAKLKPPDWIAWTAERLKENPNCMLTQHIAMQKRRRL